MSSRASRRGLTAGEGLDGDLPPAFLRGDVSRFGHAFGAAFLSERSRSSNVPSADGVCTYKFMRMYGFAHTCSHASACVCMEPWILASIHTLSFSNTHTHMHMHIP